MAHKIWRDYPAISAELDELRTYLLGLINLSNKPIQSKIVELLSAGGKLLRPGYFYLFAGLGPNQDSDRLRAGAAAIELLHVASLIHDDVIDDAPLRRNVITIHSDYGNKNAIYAGDFMFTLYFKEVIKSARNMADVESNADVMRIILDGELHQMQLNYKLDVTIDEYLDEINGKTAKLFELACSQGARISGASADIVTTATKIGYNIGMAYQIKDDILDYSGSRSKTKKPVLEDVAQGVYTLPLILALETKKRELRQLLKKKQKINASDIKQIQQLVVEGRGVARANEQVTQYTEEALTLIKTLPEGDNRDVLIDLTAKLIGRQM